MRNARTSRWIRHSHFFGPDEYECSACGKRFPEARPVCPACGSRMDGTEKKDDWFDELAEMDMILDDD